MRCGRTWVMFLCVFGVGLGLGFLGLCWWSLRFDNGRFKGYSCGLDVCAFVVGCRRT